MCHQIKASAVAKQDKYIHSINYWITSDKYNDLGLTAVNILNILMNAVVTD